LIYDDSRDWLMSRESFFIRRQKLRCYAIIKINFTIAFNHQSLSFCIEQKKSWFTTSIEKSNASWNDSLKHKSKRSRSRFKQSMISLLQWMIFKRNLKRMWSQLIEWFLFQSLFNTSLWKDLASLRSSSICCQLLKMCQRLNFNQFTVNASEFTVY